MNKKRESTRRQSKKESTLRNTEKEEECEGKLKEIRRKEQVDRSVVPSLRKGARRRRMVPEARN